MLGKLVLCAVLCLFVNQVVYARPQEIEVVENEVGVNDASADNYGLLRITSCRTSLRKVLYSIAMLGYQIGLLYIEILAAVIESIKCLISGSVGGCAQDMLSDTIDGMKNAISDFANHIVGLGQNLADGIRNCLLSTNNANYQLFLDSSNYSKLSTFKSS